MASQQKPVEFQAEENELYTICAPHNVAVYKWFDMIRIELSNDDSQKLATVHFGKTYEDGEVPISIAKQIRSYVKEQKRQIRDNPRGYTSEEGRQRIFWLLTMFLEHGVFTGCGIGKIQTYTMFVFSQTREDE